METPRDTRVALVTGANKGIGLAVARRLARERITVLIGARQIALGDQAAAGLRAEALDATAIAVDVTREDTIAAAAKEIEERFGRLDILVNNAGVGDNADGHALTADLGALRRIFETNLLGTLAVSQAMIPLLRKSPAGRIVNVSSGLGSLSLTAQPDSPVGATALFGYKISKAALNLLTIDLARDLRGASIKVNSVTPGYVTTDINVHLPPPPGVPRYTLDEAAEVLARYALLPDDGPTGGFFGARGPIPW